MNVADCLIAGGGFIGRAVAEALGPAARLVRHDAVDGPGLLDGVRVVLWAGRHPDLGTPEWAPAGDLELRMAQRAASAHVSFVSLGTRKVYASARTPLGEDARIGPTDLYGRQKLQLEHALADILGPRLTRLRLANIFGYEHLPSRASFLGRVLATLAAEGEVRFDMSPFVTRDFLPIGHAAAWIAAILRRPPGGIVNVGSGVPLPTGRLALWVIEGYGRGRLVVLDPREQDAFVLRTDRLKGLVGGATCTPDDLRAVCLAIGRRLREETTTV